MNKLVLCILFSAGFIHLASSESNVECFYTRLITKVAILAGQAKDLNKLCQESKTQFDELRKDIKDCKANKVSVDGVETLANKFCNDGDLSKRIVDKLPCFQGRLSPNPPACWPKQVQTTDLKKAMKQECDTWQDMLKCANSDVGKPCEAEDLTKMITEGMATFYDGWCKEVNGASVNKMFFWSLMSGILFVMMFWKQKI